MAKPSKKEPTRPEITTPRDILNRAPKGVISAEDSAEYMRDRITIKLKKAQGAGPFRVPIPRDKYNEGALALVVDEYSLADWVVSIKPVKPEDRQVFVILTSAATVEETDS